MSSDSSRSNGMAPNPTSLAALQQSRREIRPLPSRPKSSCGPPGRPQTFVNHDRFSPTPPPPTDLSCESHRRHSYQSPGVGTDERHLSPPLAGPPFQFGQTHTKPPSIEQHETFTFRSLHNVTPLASPKPEEIQCPHAPQCALGDQISSPLMRLPPLEHEYPLPLHTLPLEENTTVSGIDDLPELAVQSHTDLLAEVLANKRLVTPSQPVPSLSFTQPSELSPTSGKASRRISDASIASERSETPIPYDVRDEKAPTEPFYTLAFQAALSKGLDIAKSAATFLDNMENSLEPRADRDRLLKDASDLSTFHGSDTRTIAVLGDSGEGKSSLINSLLHIPEIAKTGDIGSACTSVVTEYRQKTEDHKAPFTIEVEYLSTSEIKDLITELVWSYRKVFLPETEENTVSAEDYTRFHRESEHAWSALEAAFKHQELFRKEFLSDMSDGGAQERVTRVLIQWTQDIDWPDGGNDGVWVSTANTAEECCEKTSVFMQDKLWPFTRIIRVFLNAQVLKTGIVLADLPGLHDTNLARVRATQNYLLKCDHVFVVAKIARAITDQSLKSSLYAVIARHVPLEWEESAGKSLKLAVICTKSEDINLVTARREFCGPNKRVAQAVMEQLDEDIEQAKQAKNRSLKKELRRKQDSLLIDARNCHVKEGLQRAYATKVPGGNLDVFCVSNMMYEKFSRKGNLEMVSSSGIPDLRCFCHSITASAQLLEAKHFLQSKLSSLLNSIELWAASSQDSARAKDDESDEETDEETDAESDEESDDSILQAVDDVRNLISRRFKKSKKDFNDSFRESVLEFLEKRNDDWEQAAEAKGEEWHSVGKSRLISSRTLIDIEQWHHTQYNSWCLNDGKKITTKRGNVDWNADLIWKMRMELDYQWDMVEDEVRVVFRALVKSARRALLTLQSDLEQKEFDPVLVEGVLFRIQAVEYEFSRAEQNFAKGVKGIRHNASESSSTSYVLAEMIPAYRSAVKEKGKGYHVRQLGKVQGRITNGTLFPNISTNISSGMEKLVKKTFNSLRSKVEVILSLVDDDVEMALKSRRESKKSIDEEENIRRKEFGDVIKALKERHTEVLGAFNRD